MQEMIMNQLEKATGLDIDKDGDVGQSGSGQGGEMDAPEQKMRGAFGPGNHKALFIGINYFGQKGELRGCVNDVSMMSSLIKRFGFPEDNFRILVDDENYEGRYGDPTKSNIEEGFRWLIDNVQSGDTLFLHYSGHGTQMKDDTGDESDGKDEALCPVDYSTAGLIRDDDILRDLIVPLPDGVRLTAVLDCCHSGTLLDLPFMFVASKENLNILQERGLEAPLMQLAPHWMDPQIVSAILGKISEKTKKSESEGKECSSNGFTLQSGSQPIGADIIMFSGCKDCQTSADVSSTASFTIPEDAGVGGAGGACTAALTEAITKNPNLGFVELLKEMQNNLEARKFTQVPQLSSSKPIDLAQTFSLFGEIQTGTAEEGAATKKQANKKIFKPPQPSGRKPKQNTKTCCTVS